jgi:hypothetical protein
VQAVHFLLAWQRRYKVKDTAFDELAGYLADVLLPEDNYLPRSLHLVRKVVGVDNWRQYEVQLCAGEGCPGHVYKQLQSEEYEAHRDDKCPVCNIHPRFETVRRGNKTVLQPHWWMIHLPLAKVREFMC